LECGGKRSATPLWISDQLGRETYPKRRSRCTLPAHSKMARVCDAGGGPP
jgi:hypothetical protein